MDNISQAARCEGKKRFDSAILAHQVVIRAKASKRRRDKLCGTMKAYSCPDCHGWHIGGAR